MSKKIYVVETQDGLEYSFDFDEVHDVVLHPSGALVVEGVADDQTHAFAPGGWTRWFILDVEPDAPAEEPA